MAGSAKPVKAELIELTPDFTEKKDGKRVTVQFNPETLKVSFANQLAQSDAGNSATGAAGGSSARGDQGQKSSRQFVGAGTTKLALQLWFDVNAPLPSGKEGTIDVRELTKDVAYFITPQKAEDDPKKFLPPVLRFAWGSFSFEGIVDSLDESLEFFSDEGLPLRASMNLSMSRQKIDAFHGQASDKNAPPPGVGAAPGTRPLAQAAAGLSLQAMVDVQGGADWQAVASVNGIENPRLLRPGQLIDLNVQAGASVSAGVAAGGSVSAGASVGVSGSAGISGGAGAAVRFS
jgi:hypothetical protein